MGGSHVHHGIDRSGGVQLYSDSLATPTPQTFGVTSPPASQNRPQSRPPPPRSGSAGRALHPGPYPPDLSRHKPYGASTTVSLALHLLISLDGPTPSGSTGTPRR